MKRQFRNVLVIGVFSLLCLIPRPANAICEQFGLFGWCADNQTFQWFPCDSGVWLCYDNVPGYENAAVNCFNTCANAAAFNSCMITAGQWRCSQTGY